MSLENSTDQISESQEVQEHRRTMANRTPAEPSDADLQVAVERFSDPQFDNIIKEEEPVDLNQAAEHFNNDAYDLPGELVDDGLIQSKARRGVQAESRANTKAKLRKMTALAASVITLAGVGQVSGANQVVVEGAKDQVGSLIDFAGTEPTSEQPSIQEVQQNVAETVIDNMPQDATQAEQAEQLEQHGISKESTQIGGEQSQPEPVVNQNSYQTGGTNPGEVSGGTPAGTR